MGTILIKKFASPSNELAANLLEKDERFGEKCRKNMQGRPPHINTMEHIGVLLQEPKHQGPERQKQKERKA